MLKISAQLINVILPLFAVAIHCIISSYWGSEVSIKAKGQFKIIKASALLFLCNVCWLFIVIRAASVAEQILLKHQTFKHTESSPHTDQTCREQKH